MKFILPIGLLALGVGLVAAGSAQGSDFPEWAYPVNPPVVPPDAKQLKDAPGSAKKYTQAQIDDDFAPPDWYPEDHPPMPPVVARGRPPAVRACAKCHLTNGVGHPESAGVAGQPLAYFMRQMADMKSGARQGARATSMLAIAAATSDDEARAAAEYFGSITPKVVTEIVETDTVPRTYLGQGAMRFAVPGGGNEAIGNRIIEIPQDPEMAERRNPRTRFTAFVPQGALAKGEKLVKTGGAGKTVACATCHGPDLKGVGEVPGIVGCQPVYVFRQLNDIKAGTRRGAQSLLMKPNVVQLDQGDMVAISAYLASLAP